MVDAAAPTARISILTASIKIALRQSLAGLVHDHESVGAPIWFPGVIPLGVFNSGHFEPSCPTAVASPPRRHPHPQSLPSRGREAQEPPPPVAKASCRLRKRWDLSPLGGRRQRPVKVPAIMVLNRRLHPHSTVPAGP